MIIKRLTLHNFGVYAGTNTFSFQNDKPVVLIGGMNGRGKTTFLNAVLLALYGSNSFAYKDSKYKSYGQYLRSLVNESDNTMDCFVQIEFKINANDTDVYVVKRMWNSRNKRTREVLEVEKNYITDDFLSDNWLAFFENILPSALSPYFFFDGDNIAELAVESTDEKMKASIKALLGITVLDKLESDLNRLNNKMIKKGGTVFDKKKIDSMRAIMETDEKALQEIDNEIVKTEEKNVKYKKQLESKNAEYIARGGLIVEQRQEMFQTRSELKMQLQQLDHNKTILAASEYPLVLVKDILGRVLDRANSSHESIELTKAARIVSDIQQRYSEKDNADVKAFVDYINKLANDESKDVSFDFSDSTLFQLDRLVNVDLEKRGKEVKTSIDESKRIAAEIEKLDAQLSTDVDENEVKQIYKSIKKLEQRIVETSEIYDRLQRQRSEINGKFIRSSSDYNHYIESCLSELEMKDELDRMQKYSGIARTILREYKVRLQKQKIGTLTKTITHCFKQIANKQNLINKIEMDTSTLDFIYINKDGVVVPKASLSEGEKQMLIISILWALAICSKRKLPVIIDTPLARLDSAHRKALINTYFPNAGEQTIILSTDSEISGSYYRMLKKHISDEYTLIYDDKKKCSHVVRGYFQES